MLKASPVVQTVKNPPAMQETRVWSLGQEDPLEKEMATIHYHKNFVNVLSLSLKIPYCTNFTPFPPAVRLVMYCGH